jgi:hypothetical protein
MTNNRYIPNRYGALLKFKAGVTEQQIARALNSIKDIIDLPDHGIEYAKDGSGGYRKVPFRWSQIVQKYDDRHGDPVFYIP